MNAICRESIPSYICAGIYLADWRTACLADLDALNIGLVVTAMTAHEVDYYGIEGAVDFEGADWHWLDVEDDDAVPLWPHFADVCRRIDAARAAGKAVLVHCMAGVSRSPTLVAAYLMHNRRWEAAAALAYIKERRACMDPNAGFVQQLLEWEARSHKIDVGGLDDLARTQHANEAYSYQH